MSACTISSMAGEKERRQYSILGAIIADLVGLCLLLGAIEDGHQTRSFVRVGDCVDATLGAACAVKCKACPIGIVATASLCSRE